MEWTASEIKRQRQVRGWDQDTAAEKLGVGRRTLSSWETGKATPHGTNRAALNRVYGPPTGETVVLDQATNLQLGVEFARRISEHAIPGQEADDMQLLASLLERLAAGAQGVVGPDLPGRDVEWAARRDRPETRNESHPGHMDEMDNMGGNGA